MRIGLFSYPGVFERPGGVQAQMRETARALCRQRDGDGASIEATLGAAGSARLGSFDLIHVFAAGKGNEALVAAAVRLGKPVVLSPLVSYGWNRANGSRARVADRVLGNSTGARIDSAYAQTRRALALADRVLVLGSMERKAVCEAFLADPRRVRLVAHGVASRFLLADPALFRTRTGIRGPFVLTVGAISPYKNQLGLARALSGMALPLVSIGEAQERDAAYLRQVKSLRNVTCLGSYAHDDPMLASAYAAAAVFALPSQGEQYPLTVIEALAAGTPALVGQQCTLDVAGAGVAWRRIGWNTVAEQQAAVSALIERPPARAGVSALVRDHTWDSVAVQLLACYRELLAPSQRGPGRPGSPATLLADA